MNISKFIDGLADKSQKNIRASLYQKGIMANYHPSDGRMIFYTSKNTRFNSIQDAERIGLWRECNGLIISEDLRVLVTPPESFKSNIVVDEVNRFMGNNLYDLYMAEDGTVINMYYWPPMKSWRISTARAYDITDIKWGSLTYREIVCDLLNSIDVDDSKFYESLDEATSYTFGFKHSSMHPFAEGAPDAVASNKLWFIQSVTDGRVSYDFGNKFNIRNQRQFEFPAESPRNIRYLLNQLNISLDKFLDGGSVLYGFILRSRDRTVTGIHSDILLESALLQKIRQLYYHSNYNDIATEMRYNRETFTIIAAYLNINNSELFIKLFPQFKPTYAELDAITKKLVSRILTYSKNNDVGEQDYLSKSVKFIHDSINNQYNIMTADRNNTKLISSYVKSDKFTELYYGLFTV